jgi:YD repeat-containing protein
VITMQRSRRSRSAECAYEHFHRVAWREEDGTRLRFEYDTEDRVTAVVNEAGERYTFELDPAGRVVKETGFDGRAREYVRDIAGRPTLTVLPSGRTTSEHLRRDESPRGGQALGQDVREVRVRGGWSLDPSGERGERRRDGARLARPRGA